MSPKAKPKSAPPTSCNSCWHRSGVMLFIKRHGVFRLQHLGLQPLHAAVQTQHGGLAHRNVQVARLAVDDRLEQFVDKDSSHLPLISPLEGVRTRARGRGLFRRSVPKARGCA